MGFGVNNFNNKPIIKEAQGSQDGGAGNLGYFEREEKRRKEEEEQSVFAGSSDELDIDSFKKHDEVDSIEDFSISKIIAEMIFSIKEWFKNLLGLKSEESTKPEGDTFIDSHSD